MTDSMKRLLIPVLFALFLSGCAASTNPISGRRAFNYAWVSVGGNPDWNESDSQIIAQYGLYEDIEVAAYVDSLGQELVNVSHFRRPEGGCNVCQYAVLFPGPR